MENPSIPYDELCDLEKVGKVMSESKLVKQIAVCEYIEKNCEPVSFFSFNYNSANERSEVAFYTKGMGGVNFGFDMSRHCDNDRSVEEIGEALIEEAERMIRRKLDERT
jgi:hypothetical protein